jgi:hypothetical protein
MKKTTKMFILMVVILITIYDIVAYLEGGNEVTISGWFWEHSKRYPIIPFAWGVISGHLFWVRTVRK